MELGYAVEEFWLREPGMTGQRFSQLLETRSICGVIVAPLPRGRGHVPMEWGRFCLATINYSLWRPALHRAAPRQTSGVSLAVRHLRRLGYNRIGLALPLNIDARANHNWSASFLMNRHRLAGSQPWPLLLTRHWNERQFGEWFRSHRPDVVMSTEEEVLEWLRRLGARVPDDAGYVNLEWSDHPPDCCGIRPSASRVGAAAVDLVVEQLEHNERGLPAHPKTVLIDGEWVPGSTVVSRPAAETAAA
jgi:LacI family transcriptional regulator